jgi:hypothetical protein
MKDSVSALMPTMISLSFGIYNLYKCLNFILFLLCHSLIYGSCHVKSTDGCGITVTEFNDTCQL